MTRRPALVPAHDDSVRTLDRGFWLVVILAVAVVLAMVARVLLDPGEGSGSGDPGGGRVPAPGSPSAQAAASAAPLDTAAFVLDTPRVAPPLVLTNQDDETVSLASFRGDLAFVFFGYTHCPDVCPATIGTVGLAMDAFGPGARGVFVSVDPERDTTTWLREYVRFLPVGFSALTGSDAEVRTAADAWGVQYARVETGNPAAYSMAHTADVFLVDRAGMLRAIFPFGTEAEAMTAVLRDISEGAALPAPTDDGTAAGSPSAASATAEPSSAVAAAPLGIEVISSSVWSGPAGPIILDLSVDGVPLDDPRLEPIVQLTGLAGEAVGSPTRAVPVRPPGVETVSYVATLPIPTAGPWRLRVAVDGGGDPFVGTVPFTALDPGSTVPIGEAAPRVATPTLDDVDGVARAVTTDPAPDLRLSRRSTVDALAEGQPFVLVIDSTKFRVSPACGRAIIMARYLLDRWRDVGFIHLEPYRYAVVASTPVLEGSLDDPTLTDPAAAWGFGGAPWGARSMPWAFVVDGDGIVRAKYQGVMGTADVDVIVALIAQGG